MNMRNRKIGRKGSLLLISMGLMVFVAFMTTTQLDTLKMYFGVKRMMDLQRISDVAARSGIDYGYSMIKNITESMSLNEVRFATHMHSGDSTDGPGIGPGAVAEVPPYWQEIINHKFDRDAYNALLTDTDTGYWVGTDSHDVGASTTEIAFPFDQCNASIGNYGSAIDRLRSDLLSMGSSFVSSEARKGDKTVTTVDDPPEDRDLRQVGLGYAEKSESDTEDLNPDDPDSESNDGKKKYTSLDCVYQDVNQPMETLVECAQETLSVNGVVTTYTLYDATLMSGKECERQNIAEKNNSRIHPDNWVNITAESGGVYKDREKKYVLDGHFGTKRWHYYDTWDFTGSGEVNAENVLSDIDSTDPRGTGGTIRKNPGNLDGGATYFDTHRHILWERLFNYVRDPSSLRFPYEPIDVTKDEPHERDAHEDAYHVELYTVLDLTDITLDDSADTYDANLINPENYGAIKHKVFFKLWVTRDEGRDKYGDMSTAGTVVTTALTDDGSGNIVDMVDWTGQALADLVSSGGPLDIDTTVEAVDLHPIWSMQRDSGVVPNTGSPGVNIAQTSLFRDNYKIDFLDWDGDGDKSHRLGAIGFPVPYLAMQRADYDIWNSSERGTEKATDIPKEHESYTKFTLWSLCTVREVDSELLQNTSESRYSPYPFIAGSKQKISDFKIVARTLYRMDFYMDVRAVDINDEEQYREDDDSDVTNVLDCDPTTKTNINNQAYYNALKVPVCDISEDGSLKTIFDPMGIYTESQQKWPYRDSKK